MVSVLQEVAGSPLRPYDHMLIANEVRSYDYLPLSEKSIVAQ
jgi:hypothetical protein